MNTERLNEMDFPVSNSRIHLTSLAEFLKNLIIPGIYVYEKFKTISGKVKIFLPLEDRWFLMFRNLEVINKYNVEHEIIVKARDHFFKSSRIEIWNKIREEIILDIEYYST